MQEGNVAASSTQSGEAEAASNIKQELREQAERVANKAETIAEAGKRRFSERAHGVANALEQASAGMRGEDQEELARYTQSIARKIEQLADVLANRDLPSLAHDVKQFARRQPALFLGGAFTAGMVAARFMKSSARGSSSAAVAGTAASPPPEDLTESDFGPAQGGYGPATAPGTALGGNGIFGPDVSVEAADAGESALTGNPFEGAQR